MNKPIAFFPTPIEIVKYMINMTNQINPKVMETGYGEGAFLKELPSISRNDNIYGVEFSLDFYQKSLSKFPKFNLFNMDFLNFKEEKDFDLIIGNPPYIKSNKLPVNIKENVKNITGSLEANIYYAFIFKSIELLKEGGELIYILPYDFFYNTYASKLRNYMLENGYFINIIDFGENKIFEDASVETIIFHYIKNTSTSIQKDIKVLKLNKNIKYKEILIELDKHYKNKTSPFSFDNKQLQLNTTWALSNFNTLNKNTIKISEFCDTSVGMVTGCDEAFKVDKLFVKSLNSKEKTLIRKFIKNSDLNDFSNQSITYYIFIDKFVTEKELKTYHKIYEHLLKFKDILEDRYFPSKNFQWFNYLAIRNKKTMIKHLNKFKILFPSKTRKEKQWFSISEEDCFISGDLLLITSNYKDTNIIWFLFGFLNSDFFAKYYTEYGAKKGNRILFTQKILNDFDIPNFTEQEIKDIGYLSKEAFDKKSFDLVNRYVNKVVSNSYIEHP